MVSNSQLYKKSMSPLCVFLCNNQLEYDQILNNTESAKYHRFFILSSNKIVRNNFEYKNTDNFMVYSFDLSRMDMISRLVTCYSNPMYSHIIIFLRSTIDFENEKNNFKNQEYFQNKNCIGFTRQYVALNGFTFDPAETEMPLDPLIYAQELSKALSEQPVEHEIFIEALRELLPNCQFENYKDIKEISDDVRSVFNLKYKKSSTSYNVLYEPKIEKFTNAIVFSFSILDSYKFAIKRKDGLCCYIF
jgi:hypothetical protein